jgi:RHS repeat-associated protein
MTGAALLLIAAAAFAQTPPTEVSYSDNFQSYKSPSNPPGWVDTSIGSSHPEANGLYKAWPDPLDKKSTNVVFGTKQSSGKPEGTNPRIGTFSTLGTYTFNGQGRFEYRGRILRTSTDARAGLTFFSSYPETDRYYLIGLWSQTSGSNLTMQLFGFGGGTPTGTVDSTTTLTPNQWVRFLIQVDDAGGATKIRARFWPDGAAEPQTFSIDATDTSATRLRGGRIGIWAAVKGDTYVDDLSAKSPVDHSAPTITLLESGQPLADGSKFNRNAVPEIRVSDDLSGATYTATLDGAPYTSLTPVTVDGWHVLTVTAVDGPRNVSTLQINFLVDKTAPVVVLQEGLDPLQPNAVFSRNVVLNATVTDVSETTPVATLDGQPYVLGTPVTAEGTHAFTVEATDLVGWKTTAGPLSFTIDKSGPQLTFTSHQDGALLTASRIDLAGSAGDAVTVTVAGSAAVVNPATKTFTVSLALLEGENVLLATGTDRAGNVGTATLHLLLDTRAPALTINAPAADACLDTASLQVSGVASDPRLDTVKVTIGATTVTATVDANGAFTAAVPVDEGKKLITVEAADRAGHTASASRSVTVDRTAPVIEIRENGDTFAGGILNRAASIFASATDGGGQTTVSVRLDGAPYTSGTSIATEGAHTLAVTATDCAGHKSEKSVDFTIDLKAPVIRDVVPANGSTVGTMPASLSGTTDADVTSVVVVGTAIQTTPAASGAFTLAVPFTEGVNRFTLEATDRAGNRGSLEYSVTIQTSAPIVEIRESGSPVAAGALYNRAVTPSIRAVDPAATVAATLNGASYTSGTTISGDGAYTLRATATDPLGHSGSAEATFTIDRTPPVVDITAPAASTLQSDHVDVRGKAGDSVAATLNGQPLTLAADGSFVFEGFPLETGVNALVVVGHDRAGNAGRDEVLVTRDDLGAGVLLTYPPDRSRTNRPATDVIGRLVTPGRGTVVTVGTTPVDVDPTGLFRLSGYPLTEGENTITVNATAANGVRTSASVRVTSDFTPPALAILESGQPLADGARFAERAAISLQSSDDGGTVVNELTIDGTKAAALPVTITAAGGHSLLAVARDLAGNEARVERTLFIGTTGGTATCSLAAFDPSNGAVILANRVRLAGRSGGAIGVKVNGVVASMADGSFSVDVELPAEGANEVTIVCTDANGNPTGTPEKITLVRVTGDPSIAITQPAEDFVSAQETIAVTGTVGPGVVSADVNGVAATISGSTFTVPNVRLAAGLNLLVAHAKNAGGRIGTASRRGVYLKDAPSIAISTPATGAVTGTNSIHVSGTFTNLDPASVVVANAASGQSFPAQATRLGDTTGSFTAAVALVSGEQTLRVSGRDRLNREASATVTVRLTAGTPGITIAQPAAHACFGGGSDSFTVSGTFSAATGSQVDVNGITATVSGSSYTASVKFSTLAGGITPVVARVTQPDGASASASTVVTQLAAAPSVVETFPAANAVEVDTGALLLVLFSQPMDRASMTGAVRVEDSNGAAVSGSLYLDKEVLTFAPATLLAPGTRYTIRVSTAAKNLAGTPLAGDHATSFTTATTAPSTPPVVNAPGAAVCGQTLAITGTAAPGARLRLEAGTLTLSATADTAGRYTFSYPLTGQSGFLVLRVRVVGSDGSVSPAADVSVRIDCNGPQVLSAAFDRTVNKLTIHFSEPVDAATATVGNGSAIVLTLDDGRVVGGTAAVAQNLVTVTPAENLGAKTFTLTVNTTLRDTIGNVLVAPYGQTFTTTGSEPVAGDGSGFISGEVYDATTGRPLAGALISIAVPSGAPIRTNADARGRYLARLREGAHTIKASLAGYTSVWRQIVVPPGAGAIPIDIRLTRRGEAATSLTLTHGGDTAVTKRVDLVIPSGALTPGRKVSLTSIGGQALIGLLPLGWSPIAAAEISVDGAEEATPLAGAQLTFQVPAAAITAAAQNLAAVQYDAVRDEWRVLASTVNIAADGKAAVSVPASGAYALVYADKAAGLTQPPLPVAGDVLGGVPAAPADAALVRQDFQLDPPIVLPTGRTVATLRIKGAGSLFPSGTAVQAYIDEELKLADGSSLLDPPFATDLLLYRTLTGDLGVADFHLAPSPRAAEVILEVGVDRIRVFPYPGRLDRGTLIGPEGGRVPADDKVAIEIATGAVAEPLRATATSLTASDLAAVGTIAGFRVVGGFQLSLQRATTPAPMDLDGDGQPDAVDAPELFLPARATFTVDVSKMPSPNAQVILAELLDQTPYGRMVRLAVPMMLVDPAQSGTPALRFTTNSIDRSLLPVDGVMHEGRYVLLAAEAPIAFATGTIRLGSVAGRLLAGARILASPLGVAELSRATGIYNIPVVARPAGPFALVPRHTTTGDGAAYTHAAAVDAGSVVRVDLTLVPQPPLLGNVVVLKGEPPSQATLTAGGTTTNVSLTTNVRASFSPGIDPASVVADSITVTDATTGRRVEGAAAADGSVAVVWTIKTGDRLKPNGSYIVAVNASIRGTNGASLARSATFNFSTVTEILNSEIHRERVRITIPDANGLSRITGTAGAIPAGWQAVAVRRNRDFLVRYQATAAGDGSFSFVLGNGGDAADKVTIADVIDLQVVSNIGNVAALFALTPFTSEDGKSFVVPAGAAIRYTSPEGFTLDVPAGAFDEATVVRMTPMKKEDFLDIPLLETENNYHGSVNIEFEGVANKPLGFEAPLPPGTDTAGKTFLIAQKGMSPVGPRLALVDLMQVRGDKLVIDHDNAGASAVSIGQGGGKIATNQTLTGSKFSKYLMMLVRGGAYTWLDIKVYGIGGSVGFAAIEGLQVEYDLIWDIYWSYYIPHIAVMERGGAILPIITGRRFTVTGFDPGTGLQAVSRTYDPIPFGDPGTVTPIPSTEQNYGGPYPVYGGPFRVEMADLEVEDVDIESIRNFRIRLSNGNVTVSPGATPLEGDIRVTLLNASKGRMVQGTAGGGLTLPAEPGNRVVLLIEERRVDSKSPLSVVFSEPIYTGVSTEPSDLDDFLRNQIKVAYATPLGGFSDITAQVRFTVDSGKRRVNITLPSALQSEARYRLTLQPQIADVVDDAPGLKLGVGTDDVNGQRVPVGGGFPLELFFDVRKPAGSLSSFSGAPTGLIRGMELAGNVLFVAAQDGGLRAYDVSNPAVSAPALGYVPGPPEGGSGALAVTVDRHNRVYTTQQQPASGAFRSYRVEDFVSGGEPAVKGSKLINWKIGFSQGLGLPSNTLLSDIPESIPFRIKVVLADDEQTYPDRKAFLDSVSASETGDYPKDDMKRYTVTAGGGSSYGVQRVTVENVTLDMRWSADGVGGAASIPNVVARSTDKMRVIKNLKTYAIVAHLGYGIAVYDANAIEHNRHFGYYTNHPSRLREQMVLTNGVIDRDCPNPTPDSGIVENYITTDAELGNDVDGSLYSYSVDTSRGILDLKLQLPDSGSPVGTRDDTCGQRPSPNTGGLLFRSYPGGSEGPRIQAVRGAIAGAAGREPIAHFGALARYHWSITAEQNKYGTRGFPKGKAGERDYLLVAGAEYGLIVVEVESQAAHLPRWPLTDEHVADVIWIPGGVHTVRSYPEYNVAVVGDRYGRVLIVDLSRLDERWDDQNNPFPSGVFPTLAKALQGIPDGSGIGADDPRILWKSAPGVYLGAAAPVLDPATGMVFAGNITQVRALAGIDPKVEMKVNLGEPGGLSTVGGVVPLGVPLPKNIETRIAGLKACDGTTLACKENASLAAFRLEVSLPGDMVTALTNSQNQLQLAVESERVVDAVTEQTPAGFPRAHLRRTRRDGSAEIAGRAATAFKFRRVVPPELAATLKSQRGYNKFVSPWIVAIADPRAAQEYAWREASTKQQKKDFGCDECERPEHLKGKGETDEVYELWTNGRYIAVRPELTGGTQTIFTGTQYAYLGLDKRLLGRFSTVIADTVRATDTVAAGQNPAVASGALQETTFVHSGEVESSTMDLDAGGRAGFNVTIDRTYRSRTLGASVFGQGWDSSLLRRLRALPNGDVEYRDGAEVWRFHANPETGYDSPKGLFLKLARTARGWTITDQRWRIAEFDDMGRLLSEADEFFSLQEQGSGNVIRYFYDEAGLLSRVIDPVKRESTLTYWREGEGGAGAYPGLVKQIVDWRDRKIEYEYDPNAGTLVKVKLADVTNASGGRPAVEYTYAAGGAYSDNLELRNLETVKEPHEVLAGGPTRVKFTYDRGGNFRRDRVLTQQWGTGETASFEYPSKTQAKVTDVLGQEREYTMNAEPPKNYFDDRPHVKSEVEKEVTISSTALGQLPGSLAPGAPPTTSTSRTSTFDYDAEGLVRTETLAGARSATYTYTNATPAPGFILGSVNVSDLSGAGGTVTRGYTYQSGANRSTFLKSVSAGGLSFEAAEANRNYREVTDSNNGITATSSFDSNGLQTRAAGSGGTDSSSAGSNVSYRYAGSNAAKHERGLLTGIDDGGLSTEIRHPSATQTIHTDPRQTATTMDFDAWDRPTHVRMAGPQTTVDETLDYDANGRIVKHTRKQGSATVTKTMVYDVMSRPTRMTIDNVAGGGTRTRSIAYNLSGRTAVTTLSGGAVTTVTFDTLGRKIRRETTTGSSGSIIDYYAHDLLDNVVFTSDQHDASAMAYDGHGRAVGAMGLDGVKTTASLDAWGRPTTVETKDGASATIGGSTLDYTPGGMLRSVTTKLDAGRSAVDNFAWDGAARLTGVSSSGRATHSTYDQAGRPLSTATGSGGATAVSDAVVTTAVSGHDGRLPRTASSSEKSASSYDIAVEYNALSDSLSHSFGDLEWRREFDQAGNVTAHKPPSRGRYTFEYDSTGALRQALLPGGAAVNFGYTPIGALASYTDPANEVTEVVNDLIGRPLQRKYRDGTTEEIVWDGRRVASVKDRQSRAQTFGYNSKGQIATVNGPGGVVLDTITYDAAGRIAKWENDDSVIEYSDYDMQGHPRRTSQSRKRGGAIVDTYTQQHTWDEHGERTSWTMPTYDGFRSNRSWTTSVTQQHDTMGNVTRIERTLSGSGGGVFLDAQYRNAGRPDRRTVTTPAGETLLREYGYHSGNGLMNRMAVVVDGRTIAGSEVRFDGLQRVAARLLGLSGGARADEWLYDERSRLKGSALGRDADSVPQTEELSAAGFRGGITRTATTPADPPSIEYTEHQEGGHKISLMRRGQIVEDFVFHGGERVEDGRFVYQYDARGRLISATEKATVGAIRRIRYAYNGRDRLVGRRAEYAVIAVIGTTPKPEEWKLEDRPAVLGADSLPPDTTFVWDPMSDQLVALFRAGSSNDGDSDPNGGLLRQILHGGLGYDDPLEVATAGATGVSRLYPIYDEAGASSLQVITDEQGRIVSRSMAAGPYGGDQVILSGPAVDKVAIAARKNAAGQIVAIDIIVRSTEAIDTASVNSGFRLAAVDANGGVRTASARAAVADGEARVQWSLTGDDWAALTSGGGAALSIAATSNARGAAWSATLPFMAAPPWAVQTKPVYASAALPLEVRESLAGLSQWLASIPSGGEGSTTLYEIPNLYAIGTPRIAEGTAVFTGGDPQLLIVSSAFHAHPFQDPLTGKNYVRARWFDLRTGAWLTPDPAGYVDSPNLYAYAGGDPVNSVDSTGNCQDPRKADCRRWLWNFTTIFVTDVGKDVAKIGLNVVTLGGASGIERAHERGELSGSGSVAEAYILGIANGVTAGYYFKALDAMEQGQGMRQAMVEQTAEVTGYAGISEGAEMMGRGEWANGIGRFAGGVSSGAQLILGGQKAATALRRQPTVRVNRGTAGPPPPPRGGMTPPGVPPSARNFWNEFQMVMRKSSTAASADYNQFMQAMRGRGIDTRQIRVTRGATDKVAVIGRDMSNRVNPFKQALERNNPHSTVKTFSTSAAADAEFAGFKQKYGNNIPDNVLRRSKGFAENKAWIERMKREGYTIMDIGGDEATSIYFKMERDVVYGPGR